jgi:hypothetical protein
VFCYSVFYLRTCLHVCMSTCLHVCMSACLHVYLSTCLHVCMSTCLHVSMSVCLHVYMSACPHVCMSTCLQALMLNTPYQLSHTVRHSTVTVSRCLSVLRIRSVRLGTSVKEFQITWSFLIPPPSAHQTRKILFQSGFQSAIQKPVKDLLKSEQSCSKRK